MNKTRNGSRKAIKPGIIIIISGLVTTLVGLGLGNQIAISFGIVVILVGILALVLCLPISATTTAIKKGSPRS